jgi:hypothetical protein
MREGVAKATKWSSDEVAAECERLCKAANDKLHEAKEAKRLLAALDVAEEVGDARMQKESLQQLSAVLKWQQGIDNSDAETFESVNTDIEDEFAPAGRVSDLFWWLV